MSHPILAVWLQGTTCFKDRVKRSVLFENNTHIVLKHGAHSEYLGRWSGCKNCGAFAKLYLKSDLQASMGQYGGLRAKELIVWTGRLSLHNIRIDCLTVGIDFSQPYEPCKSN